MALQESPRTGLTISTPLMLLILDNKTFKKTYLLGRKIYTQVLSQKYIVYLSIFSSSPCPHT